MSVSSLRFAVLTLMLSIAVTGAQALMLSPMVPDVATGLATSVSRIGTSAGSYGVAVAIAALLTASRMGQWDKGRAIQLAFVFMAAGLCLCAFAPTWQVLAAGQAIGGLAAGVVIPTCYALTADITPVEERSQALGKVLFGWSIAMVAGVPLAALLTHLVGWRGVFVVAAALAALMILLFSKVPHRNTHDRSAAQPLTVLLGIKGLFIGYLTTAAFMLGFYQTYTYIGDHVRSLHSNGLLIAAIIPFAYGTGFGVAVFLDKYIDKLGAGAVMPFALALVGINYFILPEAVAAPYAAMAYPFVWGVINHCCLNSNVSYLSGLSVAQRPAIMGLYTFVTYITVGIAGIVYGPIYEAHGFQIVSWMAGAGALLVAAIGILLARRAN
jgi:DHA1 family inner membrane transport protein